MNVKKQNCISYGPEHDRLRWLENASCGLRVVGAVHEILPRGRQWHTGWYLDDVFQDETVCGAVLQLPARDGLPRYVPAVQDPWNDDCYVADFYSVTDDKEDAARWADSMAKRYAEGESEGRAQERAEQRVEDAREAICATRRDLVAVLREVRTAANAIVRASLRRDLDRMRKSIHSNIKTIRNDGREAM